METTGSRSESQPFMAASGQTKESRGGSSGASSSVSDSISRGKDAIGSAANEAMNSANSDLQALRADLNSLKDTLSKFMAQAGGEAARSAREVSANIASSGQRCCERLGRP